MCSQNARFSSQNQERVVMLINLDEFESSYTLHDHATKAYRHFIICIIFKKNGSKSGTASFAKKINREKNSLEMFPISRKTEMSGNHFYVPNERFAKQAN